MATESLKKVSGYLESQKYKIDVGDEKEETQKKMLEEAKGTEQEKYEENKGTLAGWDNFEELMKKSGVIEDKADVLFEEALDETFDNISGKYDVPAEQEEETEEEFKKNENLSKKAKSKLGRDLSLAEKRDLSRDEAEGWSWDSAPTSVKRSVINNKGDPTETFMRVYGFQDLEGNFMEGEAEKVWNKLYSEADEEVEEDISGLNYSEFKKRI